MAATIGNTARLLIWGAFGGLQCISVSAVLYPSYLVQLVVVLHLTGICNKKVTWRHLFFFSLLDITIFFCRFFLGGILFPFVALLLSYYL